MSVIATMTTQSCDAGELLDHHRRELHASGIDDATIVAAGIHSETVRGILAAKVKAKDWPRKRGPAIVFPYRDVDGKPLGIDKVKPDHPRLRPDGKPVKYEWPKGTPTRLYFPPGVGASIADGCELIFTEGEKKALSATQHGFPTVAVPGVWCIYGRGSADLPEEFSRLDVHGRKVYVAYDSDWLDNPAVRQAASRFAALLKRRGAVVKLAKLDPGPNGEKVGLDDFLVAHGPVAFRKVLDEATDPEAEPPEIAKEDSSQMDAVPAAVRFVAERATTDGVYSLRCHRGEFLSHNGSRYVRQPEGDVRAAGVKYLDRDYFNIRSSTISNWLEALRATVIVPAAVERPVWLGKDVERANLVAVENGLLDVDAAIAGTADALRPHSPLWFAETCLPYPFDPTADCPLWRQVLDGNTGGDYQMQAVLQEFAGYLLTPDTDEQKFLMLHGEGKTGKSSALAALIALLGRENVSSVALERFGERFALAGMMGKLANVAAEIGEVDKVAEGHLKSLTSGDQMEFERKYLDSTFAVPTARLVFSTNNLPRFTDRSGGLWRRMILMPFNRVIPPGERIRGLDKAAWWSRSDEMPGVLNWALAGLKRLRQQGEFTVCEASDKAVAVYREESNPAAVFLREHYREAALGEVPTGTIYGHYSTWCEANGYRALSEGSFGKEVARAFPSAQKERRRTDGVRVAIYAGVVSGGE